MSIWRMTVLALWAVALLPAVVPGVVDSRARGLQSLEEANALLDEAHFAFERGDTREAMELYVRVATSGYSSPAVWTNAGTAAYRSGDVGRAVLYYHRALETDPTHTPARRSLAVVSPATNDGGASSGGELVEEVFTATSPGLFVLIGQVFLLGLSISLGAALATRSRERRGNWIAALCWSAALYAICLGLAFANYQFRHTDAEAVVLEDRAITRSEPREESTAQLELPAGTVLSLTGEPRRGFIGFRLADGRTGFISTDAIERI